MKYAFRLTRDLETNAITVHPVSKVRDSVKPYRVAYRSDGLQRYAESLMVFDTARAAGTAFRNEQQAAGFSAKSHGELTAILRADIDALKAEGYSLCQVSKLAGVPYDSIRSYVGHFNPPNHRTVAKVHLLLPLIRKFQEQLQKTLPLREGYGSTGWRRAYPRAKKYH